MPITPEQQLQLGVTPPAPGESEVDPKRKTSKVPSVDRNIYRRRMVLSEAQSSYVKNLLRKCWEEWDQNTSLLRSKLRRANDLMEGIKEPKSFPWINSSNLHMPLIEIHITTLHSVVSSTMLENEPTWYVRTLLDGQGEKVDSDIEQFLNWTSKVQLNIDSSLSDAYWNAYRDGLSIGDLDWVEEFDRVCEYKNFVDPMQFQQEFPDPQSAGLSMEAYASVLNDIVTKGRAQLKVEETRVKYRGPKLRIVELKDLVVIPTTSPSFEYAMFVGDVFTERKDYIRRMAREEWFDRDEARAVLAAIPPANNRDDIQQSQDRIEGISDVRVTSPDEHVMLQGVLKCNLKYADMDEDNVEEDFEPEMKYLVVYEKHTDSLLRMEEYPYTHGRMKYIPWRFRKRANRLNGPSIYDQLIDINEEVDTQHNQRVDSRTITTVPSFYVLDTSDIINERKDQRFYPGVKFKVKSMANPDFKQIPIAQTDLGESIQEEQNLMMYADLRTGAGISNARGGTNKQDPRAPAKKMMAQIQQSNQRVDDHMRELKIGTAEVATQMMELWYQFSPERITFLRKDPQTKMFVKAEIERSKLRSRNTFIEVARTSVTDNPTMLVQKYLTLYQLLSNDPLIGGNMVRRRELIFRLLKALRENDIDKLVPSVQDMIQELQQQQKMIGGKGPQALGERLENAGDRKKPLEHGQDAASGAAAPIRPVARNGSAVESE